MRKLQLTTVVVFLISLMACQPPVTFNEPQPANTDNLSEFPKRLQGHYLSLLDNSTLTIDNNIIQKIYDYDYTLHPNQLDSNSRISGDTLIDVRINEKTPIKRVGDSLVAHIHYIETLFEMNDDNVVRKFKGYYFLNNRYNVESWQVKKMELSKGQLTISSIAVPTDIDNLKEITETPHDTVSQYQFTPTKKQFKAFIKNGGFSDNETFVRVK
ncbi:MAG: hypothetical protein V4613_02460 [Bacteroidota bacterium]